uniref:Uncharacterized protein n=1 Tax=Arundo donax TaxID=35708 RepID=A0A0A9BC16_ARUDO
MEPFIRRTRTSNHCFLCQKILRAQIRLGLLVFSSIFSSYL